MARYFARITLDREEKDGSEVSHCIGLHESSTPLSAFRAAEAQVEDRWSSGVGPLVEAEETLHIEVRRVV